jgi:hypothetical protein
MTLSFVELMPNEIHDGVLYVSMEYATAVHLCACGCGNKVVTPLAPQGWKLTYDGESISLSPSIGNWNFSCQSHYWIVNNNVRWDNYWPQDLLHRGRVVNRLEKKKISKRKWWLLLPDLLEKLKTFFAN